MIVEVFANKGVVLYVGDIQFKCNVIGCGAVVSLGYDVHRATPKITAMRGENNALRYPPQAASIILIELLQKHRVESC